MTEAKAGYGTILKWNSEPIAEVTSITGPSLTIDQIDCTHYTSPQQFKEWIAGFGDGGEVTFDCNFIPGDTGGQIAFIADAYAKKVQEVIITLGDPIVATWKFDGMVTKLDFAQPMDNKLSFSATIKVSGVPSMSTLESFGLDDLIVTESEANGAVLVPAFNNEQYLYTIAVKTLSDTITVTATVTDPHTIKARVNSGAWVELDSGEASDAFTIGLPGTVSTLEVICYEVGKIAKTYKVYIARPTE